MQIENCKLRIVKPGLPDRNLQFANRVPLQLVLICAALLVPSSKSLAREAATAPTGATTGATADSNTELHGVSLGDYRIRSYYPVDAQKSTLRFTLYAAVTDEHYAAAQQLIDEHRQKLRDQIITATRLAPLAVFQEPNLAAFRRRIIVRIRRALPELQIDDLYVSDFDLAIKSL
jgi:hypothetical protein